MNREPHRVYWGSHGCHKSINHVTQGTHCRCNCGSVLRLEYHTYGEHADTAKPWLPKPSLVGPAQPPR